MTPDASASSVGIRGGSERGGDSPSIGPVRASDRLLIVGATGSGKTTAATIMLRRLPWVVVLDPKHQFDWQVTTSAGTSNQTRSRGITTSDLRKAASHRDQTPIVYRPSVRECDDGCPSFWRWVWERSNCVVYVDEVVAVVPGGGAVLPMGYRRAVQMGRSRYLSVWSCTQRPARIPAALLSESEHYLSFELRNPNDLKRVAEYTDPVVLLGPARGHEFWYYNVRTRTPVRLDATNLRVRRG